MKILSIRTDNPEAEVGIFDSAKNTDSQLNYKHWQAHRILSETLLPNIKKLIEESDLKLNDLGAIVCFSGPGSFTGLRIGISTANALAYGLSIPIIGSKGDSWIADGIKEIMVNKNDQMIIPNYGAPVHITKPKK